MQDTDKSKQELIEELETLRTKYDSLEQSKNAENGHGHHDVTNEKELLDKINAGESLLSILEDLCEIFEQEAEGLLCTICLVGEENKTQKLIVAPSLPLEFTKNLGSNTVGKCEGSCTQSILTCGQSILRKELVIVPDIANDPLLVDSSSFLMDYGLKSCWSMPIISSTDNILGAFTVYYTDLREPSAEELSSAANICALANIAIEKKYAAESLRMTEVQNSVLLNVIPDTLMRISSSGQVLDLISDPNNLFSISKLTQSKVTLEDLLPPQVYDKFMEYIEQTNYTGNPQTFTYDLPDRLEKGVLHHYETRIVSSGSNELLTIVREISEQRLNEFLLSLEKKVFEMIASNMVLPEILEVMCLEIEKETNGMQCSILTLDPNGKTLHHCAAPSLPKDYTNLIDGIEIGPSVGSCGTAAYTKRPVIVSNISTDPLWTDFKDVAEQFDLRACWSTPIISTDSKLIGTFAMYYKEPREPGFQELTIIERAVYLSRITIERKRSEELITQFGKILEESQNEIYIFNTKTLKLIHVNKGARDNLQYNTSELMKLNFIDVTADLTEQTFRSTVKPLHNSSQDQVDYKSYNRRKDGSIYPVEVHIQLSNLSGDEVYVTNVLDITDRMKTEDALRQSKERLQLAMDSSGVGTWDWDLEKDEIIWDGEIHPVYGKLRKYRGKFSDFLKALHPDDSDRVQNILDDCIRSGRDVELEYRVIWPDGSTHYIADRGRIVKDDALNPTRITGVCIDISRIKNVEHALQKNLDQLSKKNRYEAIHRTITQSVHSTIDLEEVLNRAADVIINKVDNVDNLAFYLVENNAAVLKAHRNLTDEFIEQAGNIPYGKGFTWNTIITGQLTYCADAETDTLIGPAGRKLGIRSYASVPLKFKDKVIGAFNLNSKTKNACQQEELILLELIADQLETAIDNARQAEALRQSEQKYRTLFEQSPVGVYIFNADYRIIQCNEQMAEILESSQDKIVGLDMNNLRNKNFMDLMSKALRGDTGHLESFYHASTSDKELWLSVRVAPLKNAAGEVTAGMAVVQDITDRKMAQEALQKSKDSYEDVVNTVEGIVWEANPLTVQFSFVSEKALSITGYTVEQWLEPDFWYNHLHPKDRDWAYKLCAEATAEKRDHQFEYRFIAADGRIIWLRDIVSVIVEDDIVTKLRGIMIDITELKTTEDLLLESAERYKTLIENTYELIIEASADGRFLYVSPNYKEVLGYDKDELLGTNIFQYVHPEDLGRVKSIFDNTFLNQTIGNAVFRYKHKNGEWRLFESSGKTFKSATGDLRCVIVSRDITQRSKIEGELAKTQKLESLGVLAGGIAHDFNNLLTAILGNINLAKSNTDNSHKIFKTLEEAEKASTRAKDLTSQLLTFSIGGGMPITKVVTTIGQLVSDSATFTSRGSSSKCNLNIEEGLWNVEIDEGQISQVVDNLVINAIQSMPQGGIVNVSVENTHPDNLVDVPLNGQKCVKIAIEDSGIGIPDQHLEKIFDPYFTTKQKGSGLGLSTVYSIIKNHGGHIDVDSSLGKGTKFSIYLPATDQKADTAQKQTTAIREGTGRILVMDDEEFVRNVVGEMLSSLGYEVEFACSGDDAIEMYKEAKESNEPYDIVIMDLTIAGGMGGKEAISILREYDPEINAVVSSGYSHDPVMSEYEKHGFRGIVAKPYILEDLSATVYDIIESSKNNVQTS